jgi:hypothetical protein
MTILTTFEAEDRSGPYVVDIEVPSRQAAVPVATHQADIEYGQ